jgi:hypothetical protein
VHPSHEAFRLLNKWKNEKTTIRLLLTVSFGAASFVGRVADVEGANIHFLSADGSSEFLLSLIAASFEYQQQRRTRIRCFGQLQVFSNRYISFQSQDRFFPAPVNMSPELGNS